MGTGAMEAWEKNENEWGDKKREILEEGWRKDWQWGGGEYVRGNVQEQKNKRKRWEQIKRKRLNAWRRGRKTAKKKKREKIKPTRKEASTLSLTGTANLGKLTEVLGKGRINRKGSVLLIPVKSVLAKDGRLRFSECEDHSPLLNRPPRGSNLVSTCIQAVILLMGMPMKVPVSPSGRGGFCAVDSHPPGTGSFSGCFSYCS